ncbi:MAG: guanylate kinase [Isosphaeraceae bacterium]
MMAETSDAAPKGPTLPASCRLIVVSGSSGSGKSTLIRRALGLPGVRARLAVSATTRAPRPGEVDHVHYHFLGPDRFREAIDRGEFLEWAEFAGNLYGTPCSELQSTREGERLLLEIEVQGALQVRQCCPDARMIWVEVPDDGALERRLRARGTETEESLARRLARARWEREQSRIYHHRILNDDLERAVAELARWLRDPAPGE